MRDEVEVSILYWRCNYGDAAVCGRHPHAVSILYWRCHLLTRNNVCLPPPPRFNSLLEMPTETRNCRSRRWRWFQFSIGDAPLVASSSQGAPVRGGFNSLLEMQTTPQTQSQIPTKSFNSLLEMRNDGLIGNAIHKVVKVSILYWRCRDLEIIAHSGAVVEPVSILYWRCHIHRRAC